MDLNEMYEITLSKSQLFSTKNPEIERELKQTEVSIIFGVSTNSGFAEFIAYEVGHMDQEIVTDDIDLSPKAILRSEAKFNSLKEFENHVQNFFKVLDNSI